MRRPLFLTNTHAQVLNNYQPAYKIFLAEFYQRFIQKPAEMWIIETFYSQDNYTIIIFGRVIDNVAKIFI